MQQQEEQQNRSKDKLISIQKLLSNGGTGLNQKYKKYTKMTQQQLLRQVLELNIANRRLKNRLDDHQPFKQKILRGPKQQKLDKLIKESPSQKYALKVCYLGWNYDGMSCQAQNDNSVEEYIFKAMHTVSLIPQAYPPDPSFTRAGRTDKGVSAMGNVISLRLRTKIAPQKPIDYCKMLNAILPEDIRIIGCEEVEPDFNARYWCKTRRYKYFFARGSLNIPLLKEVIKLFEGTHNFINYCKINVTNTVNFQRTIFSAEVQKAPGQQQEDQRNQIYYFYYVGNSFLWHQIRYMSSLLFMIGLGKQQPARLTQLLIGSEISRKPNYPMAPDYPLILEDCSYQGMTFRNTDPEVTYSFYNTFNKIASKQSIEKVMIINCMIKARQELLLSGKVTEEVFKLSVIDMAKKQEINECKKINKSSSRTLQETIVNLKGKKKQLYLKKAEKQAAYDEKVNKQKKQSLSIQKVVQDNLKKKIKPNQAIDNE